MGQKKKLSTQDYEAAFLFNNFIIRCNQKDEFHDDILYNYISSSRMEAMNKKKIDFKNYSSSDSSSSHTSELFKSMLGHEPKTKALEMGRIIMEDRPTTESSTNCNIMPEDSSKFDEKYNLDEFKKEDWMIRRRNEIEGSKRIFKGTHEAHQDNHYKQVLVNKYDVDNHVQVMKNLSFQKVDTFKKDSWHGVKRKGILPEFSNIKSCFNGLSLLNTQNKKNERETSPFKGFSCEYCLIKYENLKSLVSHIIKNHNQNDKNRSHEDFYLT